MPLARSLVLLMAVIALPSSAIENLRIVDLADVSTDQNVLLRAHGHTGTGAFGVPVAGGFDVDGDGSADYAFSSMRASPRFRSDAGEVYLLFGDSSVNGALDTRFPDPDILTFIGDGIREVAGSELWMDDVTGDGLGDLLIARQNFSPEQGRTGAGALTVVVGGEALRSFAATGQHVDLRAPPGSLMLTTIVGDRALDRLGIWMRTGDVTGDGIADIVVGADQTTEFGETHRGAVYLIRGGPHLAANQTIDLAEFGTRALPGKLARITPPPGSAHFHFGATVQLADLDGNGRAEVLVAAALNRAGASIAPPGPLPGPVHGRGGAPDGTLFIAWDDNFTGPWGAGLEFELTQGPGTWTRINGAACNVSFGEEILGGLDYDADGSAELFVGDIVGNCATQSRGNAGSGHIFYDAAGLAGLDFDLDAPPSGVALTSIFGAGVGHISSDTALHGDFDGDGIADLGITSPHAAPLGRVNAGAFHVFFGQEDGWPATIDLKSLAAETGLRITEVRGANGTNGGDRGDVLGYSAAAADLDGDRRIDLMTNEMLGNGIPPGGVDTGNLIILKGSFIGGIDFTIEISTSIAVSALTRPGRGVVPVVIHGSERFDVDEIDPSTLRFGRHRAPLAHQHGPHTREKTDLVAHFRTDAIGLDRSAREVCLTGALFDGSRFEGCLDL